MTTRFHSLETSTNGEETVPLEIGDLIVPGTFPRFCYSEELNWPGDITRQRFTSFLSRALPALNPMRSPSLELPEPSIMWALCSMTKS